MAVKGIYLIITTYIINKKSIMSESPWNHSWTNKVNILNKYFDLAIKVKISVFCTWHLQCEKKKFWIPIIFILTSPKSRSTCKSKRRVLMNFEKCVVLPAHKIKWPDTVYIINKSMNLLPCYHELLFRTFSVKFLGLGNILKKFIHTRKVEKGLKLWERIFDCIAGVTIGNCLIIHRNKTLYTHTQRALKSTKTLLFKIYWKQYWNAKTFLFFNFHAFERKV